MPDCHIFIFNFFCPAPTETSENDEKHVAPLCAKRHSTGHIEMGLFLQKWPTVSVLSACVDPVSPWFDYDTEKSTVAKIGEQVRVHCLFLYKGARPA